MSLLLLGSSPIDKLAISHMTTSWQPLNLVGITFQLFLAPVGDTTIQSRQQQWQGVYSRICRMI